MRGPSQRGIPGSQRSLLPPGRDATARRRKPMPSGGASPCFFWARSRGFRFPFRRLAGGRERFCPFPAKRMTIPPEKTDAAAGGRGLILISNKMLYLKSRVFHTLVPHVPCVTPSHKNLIKSFSSFLSGFSMIRIPRESLPFGIPRAPRGRGGQKTRPAVSCPRTRPARSSPWNAFGRVFLWQAAPIPVRP